MHEDPNYQEWDIDPLSDYTQADFLWCFSLTLLFLLTIATFMVILWN